MPTTRPKKPIWQYALILLVGLIVVGALGAVMLVVHGLVNVSDTCSARTAELEQMAKQNVARLNGLTIISGQHQPATGAPDGDCLTGSNGPATAVYPVTGTISDINAQISRNLRSQHFEMSSNFYSEGAGNTSVTDIWTTASDGKSILEISYKLDSVYYCPANNPACAGPGIVEETHLLNAAARQVTVTLGGAISTPEPARP